METREAVEFVGVQAVLVAAGLHLVRGTEEVIIYVDAGLLTDVRPYLYVVSALALILGVVHLYLGGVSNRRRLYWFFLAGMVGYLAGYVAWHVAGHPTLVGGHHHPGNPVVYIVDHLASVPFALANAVVEVVGIGAFGWLLATEERGTGGSSSGD